MSESDKGKPPTDSFEGVEFREDYVLIPCDGRVIDTTAEPWVGVNFHPPMLISNVDKNEINMLDVSVRIVEN